MATTLSSAADKGQRDETTRSFPPSHILQDGRFIYLPPPTDAERAKFLERSIARHHLIGSDLGAALEDEAGEEEETEKKDSTQPTVHPLAIASARLQANGIAELSKAINLSGLVSTGDYFGLTNIVNPSLEVPTSEKAPGVAPPKASPELAEEQRLRAEYIGKRKRLQFEEAAEVLERHERRLAAAVTAQSILDRRLRELRPQWRLVAPEHGTRAQPHAVRPSELVAIDVDVYDRDRTGGGIQSLAGRSSAVGRIARRVPRYATLELQDDYKVKEDLAAWKRQYTFEREELEEMNDDTEKRPTKVCKTRAEPFAVADPTLGKVDVDFDPDKVPMLTLQFDIGKPSTGFQERACLSPLTTVKQGGNEGIDEDVVISLQHSLFCASLFESIRQELVPHDDGEEKTVGGLAKVGRTVWLSSEMDDNFLPPPSLMAGGDNISGGGRSLSVIHCHEGEVMVQLDCEYSLTVRLAEAGTSSRDENSMHVDEVHSAENGKVDSGSQSPGQLQALCRALLLHAQTVYHKHSIKSRANDLQNEKKQAPGLARVSKKDKIPPARILESCVNLGAKMILERKIRGVLGRVRNWLQSTMHSPERFAIEWLSLSAFDLHSQFTLCFLDDCMDVSLHCDKVKVTNLSDRGFRQICFHLDTEFEMFLKMEFQRRIRAQEERQRTALTPTTENLEAPMR